jgi:D-alanyl-D-alanine carboxypeptidase (penicillin-binding protein 5/6)
VAQIRRHVYVRRRIGFGAILALLLAVAIYLPMTLLAPLHTVDAVDAVVKVPVQAAPVLSMPSYGASAISAVGFPGVFAQGGSSSPLPIASITKIVTTLVVLEKKPLAVGKAGPAIPFTAADAAISKAYLARNGEVYPIRVGGSMSERDVLTVTLVASANNYARALVDWAYGSEAQFVPVANAWLARHGLKSTTLTDATGLNSENRSTPTDLIALGKIALADPLVSRLVAIRHTTLPVVGAISNTNTLLGVQGVRGIKTGTLDKAGSSLLFASVITVGGQKITLIGVILDGPTHPVIDGQIRRLIASVKGGFSSVTLSRIGQDFGAYRTVWGARASAIATRSTSVVVWAGTPVQTSVTTDRIGVTRKGTVVGAAVFTVAGQTITVPLALSAALDDPGSWWRLTHPGKL